MPVEVLLAAQTAAGLSSPIEVEPEDSVVLGIRALNADGTLEIPIGEYIGCPVWQVDDGGNITSRATDTSGRALTLSTPRPQVTIKGAGSYVIEKGLTINKLELWGSGRAWSPARLTGLVAWYDRSDFATMFQTSAGVTPVTAVEQPCGLALDKSAEGNDASQATLGSRPNVSARKNWFTRTEEFGNAAWSTQGVTVLSDTAIAPDGTMTADSIVFSTGLNDALFMPSFAAGTWTISVWAKSPAATGTFNIAIYNPTDGVLSSPDCVATTTWQRFSWTVTATATTNIYPMLVVDGIAKTIYAWGAQLEKSSAESAYQRVVTATDYDSVGFPRYLHNDGVDDAMETTFPDLGTDVTIARSIPGVGAVILTGQTIGAGVWTDSTDSCEVIIFNRALTGQETSDLTDWLDAKGGV